MRTAAIAALLTVVFVLAIPVGAAPADGRWSPSGKMTAVRSSHTATLLADGRVLVAGGSTGAASLASAELYDPKNGRWTATGSMAYAHSSLATTRLPGGRVLAVGTRLEETDWVASAELYDPATGIWTPTTTPPRYPFRHTATTLNNGKVLVVGSSVQMAELYDPTNGSWSLTEGLAGPRPHLSPTTTLLPNGKVLVVGGIGSGNYPTSAVDLYDPATGSWTQATSMHVERVDHTATLLANGKVLVAGGAFANWAIWNPWKSAELYDPAANSWTLLSDMNEFHSGHTAALLPDGRVLLAAGVGASRGEPTSVCETYDPSTGSWSLADDVKTPRTFQTATLLPSGEVMVAGGTSGTTALASAERYRLAK